MAGRSCSSAMVMTAGLGTRLRPFTLVETKALLPVLGIPAIQYAVDALSASGVSQVVSNVHHLPEKTKVGLLKLDLMGRKLTLKDETSELLGSGGGLRNALADLGSGPFFKANADVISDLDWAALYETHTRLRRAHGVVLTLALYVGSGCTGKYAEIFFDADKKLVTGVGAPQVSKPFWTGAAVVEPEALDGVPKEGPFEFVPEILKPAIRTSRVGAFVTDGLWCDMGSPELWLDAHFDLMKRFESTEGLNPRLKLWKERFLSLNEHVAPGVWVESKNPFRQGMSAAQFKGPCYLGRESGPLHPDLELGPHLALYHPVPEAPEFKGGLENGIAFGGYWVKK